VVICRLHFQRQTLSDVPSPASGDK
jgi:hypothetical protein